MSTNVLGANSLNCDYFEIIKAGGIQQKRKNEEVLWRVVYVSGRGTHMVLDPVFISFVFRFYVPCNGTR